MTSPVFSRTSGSRPSAFMRSQIGALTRLCHTIALRDRLAGRLLPEDRRLALVGDADRGDVGRRRAGARERFARGGELRLPDRLGIVLDVAWRRKDLRKLLLRDGDDAAVAAKDDRPAGGRALIECEHVGCGHDVIDPSPEIAGHSPARRVNATRIIPVLTTETSSRTPLLRASTFPLPRRPRR